MKDFDFLESRRLSLSKFILLFVLGGVISVAIWGHGEMLTDGSGKCIPVIPRPANRRVMQ